jgi:hypothetical protein
MIFPRPPNTIWAAGQLYIVDFREIRVMRLDVAA